MPCGQIRIPSNPPDLHVNGTTTDEGLRSARRPYIISAAPTSPRQRKIHPFETAIGHDKNPPRLKIVIFEPEGVDFKRIKEWPAAPRSRIAFWGFSARQRMLFVGSFSSIFCGEGGVGDCIDHGSIGRVDLSLFLLNN